MLDKLFKSRQEKRLKDLQTSFKDMNTMISLNKDMSDYEKANTLGDLKEERMRALMEDEDFYKYMRDDWTGYIFDVIGSYSKDEYDPIALNIDYSKLKKEVASYWEDGFNNVTAEEFGQYPDEYRKILFDKNPEKWDQWFEENAVDLMARYLDSTPRFITCDGKPLNTPDWDAFQDGEQWGIDYAEDLIDSCGPDNPEEYLGCDKQGYYIEDDLDKDVSRSNYNNMLYTIADRDKYDQPIEPISQNKIDSYKAGWRIGYIAKQEFEWQKEHEKQKTSNKERE